MEEAKKFLKKTSKSANKSNDYTFQKIKDMFGTNKSPEDVKKEKRKKMIADERKRTMDSLKNREY